MKKSMKKIRVFIKYFLVFFFFLFWNLIVSSVNLDEIWNYGFTHSIYRGLIPYRDFNMVITPLFPFLMSIPFHLFGSSMLIFHIEQAFLLTIIFYLIHSYLKDKSYIFLFFIVFPLSVAFPSYNLFLFLLFLILIKLEDIKANDYLIGFVLACFVLTKQTVGMMMILPSLYYLKQPRKIFKRFIGAIIPGIIFLIYLVISKSIVQFFDLCLFGLFDFVSNSKGINIFFILGIIMFIIVLFLIRKDKKNINNYYLLAFFSVLLPLFDLYHFQIVFLAFMFILLLQVDLKIYLNIKLFTVGMLIGLTILSLRDRIDGKIIYPNNIKYFNYRYLTNEYINYSNKINRFIYKYDDREIIYLSADGYYFKIINDLDIGYLDLINTGNLGYNGSDKLLKMIKEKEDECVFFVDNSELGSNKQTDQKALKYVIKNGRLLDKVGSYSVYEIKNE